MDHSFFYLKMNEKRIILVLKYLNHRTRILLTILCNDVDMNDISVELGQSKIRSNILKFIITFYSALICYQVICNIFIKVWNNI